jgi:hypothetical protein
MSIYETLEYKGFTINVHNDDDPQNPRDWDNLGTMVVKWGDYDLGDKHDIDIEQFRRAESKDSWAALKKYLIEEKKADIILPLYIYEHSGMTISTTGFSCPWDSGRAGFIYMTAEKIRHEYSVKRITKALRKRVTGYLVNEVKTYDDYITGNTYGYTVEDSDSNEIEASCWGFFGDDHEASGLLEYAHDAIDCEIEARAEEAERLRKYKQKQVKHWIKRKLDLGLRMKLNMNIV